MGRAQFWVGILFFSAIGFGYAIGSGLQSYEIVLFVSGTVGMSVALSRISVWLGAELNEASDCAACNEEDKHSLNKISIQEPKSERGHEGVDE